MECKLKHELCNQWLSERCDSTIRSSRYEHEDLRASLPGPDPPVLTPLAPEGALKKGVGLQLNTYIGVVCPVVMIGLLKGRFPMVSAYFRFTTQSPRCNPGVMHVMPICLDVAVILLVRTKCQGTGPLSIMYSDVGKPFLIRLPTSVVHNDWLKY
jgi:hypothetical protein